MIEFLYSSLTSPNLQVFFILRLGSCHNHDHFSRELTNDHADAKEASFSAAMNERWLKEQDGHVLFIIAE